MEHRNRLRVAFLWHMHQPFYKDDLTGKYLMPWVRLRGVKDYFPMAALVERFDNVRVNFNMVPVLVEQINDYVENEATDTFLDKTVLKAGSLKFEDRLFILENFFKVNFKRMIEPNERYLELLMKRGIKGVREKELKKVAKNFSNQDLLDLQVLFNLSWFHSISVDEDANLKGLIKKKRDYSEEDKKYIIAKQSETMAKILPLYRKLQDAGRIEISTTPYYHPILPLICDTSVARVSSPEIKLPRKKFSHPEDAAWQIEEAIRYHTGQFGRPPRGMWPSEGSVSDDALNLMISKGLDWVATDEDILFKSLSLYDKHFKGLGLLDRRLIYRPYKFKVDSRHISLIFRDKNLSDMISFSYNSWEPKSAAEDLLSHFSRISENLRRDTDTGLATVIMDGENAWEYYEDNARKFFETLYSGLDKDKELKSSTISEYLAIDPPRKALANVFPGSWINHRFEIWIGDEQDNVSWDYLDNTRKDLVKFTRDLHERRKANGSDIRRAWRELYIAEGSDWNWWYAGQAGAGNNNPFDKLYRTHLHNVYKLLKKPVPDFLKNSIA
ncbi:MAG: glycoside hydrolase [Candidatus Omnitrophica bacterium]|nr:glycoside hydrolase [Candidatus Omnitrophota bacterium]